MSQQKKNKFYSNPIFKLSNALAGSKKELRFSLLVNLVLGILYSFKIWDQVAILIIFGILLPVTYTITIYMLFKIKNIPTVHLRLFKFAKSNTGNTMFLIIDLLILLTIGILLLLGILDYTIIRILLVVVIPFFCLVAINSLINDEFTEE